ncbi:hypothetical protein [Moorena sp. SIO4A5]|uniref:hypothetical protein n=1 Tax=Moorena sp. SIO4A5 TaxID=2607838 RepID=UPI0013C601E0|nr:hypothetical protein [Moorena sp. SIO4A5]NEO21429.1 hypothetical protein [Moorena sp. SIO4A5]
MIKKFFRDVLTLIGVYPAIKYTDIYDIYYSIFMPQHRQRVEQEISLLKNLIGHNKIIFDVGANGGSKTDIYRRF